MAYTTQHLLLVALVMILLAMPGQSLAARDSPTKLAKNEDRKQPEFMSKSDKGVLIPGIGRAMLPSFPIPTYDPITGIISYGHLPGGDDSSVPNPGFEVPIPRGNGGGAVQAPAGHP